MKILRAYMYKKNSCGKDLSQIVDFLIIMSYACFVKDKRFGFRNKNSLKRYLRRVREKLERLAFWFFSNSFTLIEGNHST